jgi:hypothetical protein
MSDHSSSNGFNYPFNVLVQHFESSGLKFLADPDSKSVQLFIAGDAAVYNCRIQLTHDVEVIEARIHYPVVARDLKIRPLVAEALVRANHGMSIGRFDIDMDSGDISFQLGQVIRGQGLDDEVIGGVLSAGLATADRYFPALMRVMFAGHTPEDAVYLSELDVHTEAIDAELSKPNPAPSPPKPAAEKSVYRRKEPRNGSTEELPGLFGENDDPSKDSRKRGN